MKNFTIYYEIEGSRRIDWVTFYTTDITEAISEFEQTEIKTYNTKIIYTKHAITKIEC